MTHVSFTAAVRAGGSESGVCVSTTVVEPTGFLASLTCSRLVNALFNQRWFGVVVYSHSKLYYAL
jgi:hypothetical protein